MNKTQLVDALADRLGDRRTATTAVDGVLDTIMATVGAGNAVSITGFGVFEPRARAARVARNPRTGETVDVPATTVPAFRPGAGFRSAVGGVAATPAPRATPVRARVAAGTSDAAPAGDASTPTRRAARGKAFAAEPRPVPEREGRTKAKAPGKGRDAGKGKDPVKDPGKGKKAKAKK